MKSIIFLALTCTIAIAASKKGGLAPAAGSCDADADNCFSTAAFGSNWFASVHSWSEKHFPVFPENVQIPKPFQVELDARMRGGQMKKAVILGGAGLIIEPKAKLVVG